jgi:hypothetical protein
VTLIFSLKDEDNEIGIIKDFAGIAILNEIDDISAAFICHIVRSMTRWDMKEAMKKEIKKFNKERIKRKDMYEYLSWRSYSIGYKLITLVALFIPIIFYTFWNAYVRIAT